MKDDIQNEHYDTTESHTVADINLTTANTTPETIRNKSRLRRVGSAVLEITASIMSGLLIDDYKGEGWLDESRQ